MPEDVEASEPELIVFQNAQWKVTAFGLEGVGEHAYYTIAASRLTETWDRPHLYGWPLHMSEKTWVDMDMFVEAFAFALDFHASEASPLSALLLVRSINAAHEARRRDLMRIRDEPDSSREDFDRAD